MKKSLLQKKSVTTLLKDSASGKDELKRTLTASNLVFLGIGAIIGAGIFVLTGQAAALYAGPAITISFIISGLACIFAGLCYAEFASLIPIAGSAYTYSYATFGEIFAWIVGWNLVLEYLFASATVAVGWSGYVVSFFKDFGIVIPPYLSSAPISHTSADGWFLTGSLLNLPAMLVLFVISILLIIGIKESININNVVVTIKITVILLFIIFCSAHIIPSNWIPFIPENTGKFGEFGLSGILRGAGVIFFAYIGFDAVSTAAQEAKNPQRDMPIGILCSIAVSSVLYIVVALVLTGIVSYKLLAVPDPIAVGVNAVGASLFWLRPIVKIGAVAGLTSVILVMLLGQARIFYTISKDGLLPKVFHKVHSKFRTPHIATMITATFSMMIAGLFPIGILGELVSIGTLFAFTMVSLGILILRYKEPNLHRPFKVPFVPLIPILAVITSLAQMIALPFDTWIRFVVWTALGFAIYFLYGTKHSKLNFENANIATEGANLNPIHLDKKDTDENLEEDGELQKM